MIPIKLPGGLPKSGMPRFSGAVNTQRLADLQDGPTCGFEAIENVIQLYHNLNNDLHRDLIAWGHATRNCVPAQGGYSLNESGYVPLLNHYGIGSEWAAYQQAGLVSILNQNRIALAVLYARYLYPGHGLTTETHAIVIQNFYVGEHSRQVEGYVGLDSNRESKESFWELSTIQQGCQNLEFERQRPSILITNAHFTNAQSAPCYVKRADATLVPWNVS